MYTIILLFICGLWLSTGGKLTRREKCVTRNKSPFLFSNQTKNIIAPFFKPNTKWDGSVPPTKYLLEPFHSKNIEWSHSIPFRSPTKHTLAELEQTVRADLHSNPICLPPSAGGGSSASAESPPLPAQTPSNPTPSTPPLPRILLSFPRGLPHLRALPHHRLLLDLVRTLPRCRGRLQAPHPLHREGRCRARALPELWIR